MLEGIDLFGSIDLGIPTDVPLHAIELVERHHAPKHLVGIDVPLDLGNKDRGVGLRHQALPDSDEGVVGDTAVVLAAEAGSGPPAQVAASGHQPRHCGGRHDADHDGRHQGDDC